MKTYYEEKKTFVICPLFQIVTALNPDIVSVLYKQSCGEELVVLTYYSGGGRKKIVKITGDSDFEITKKVLKAIEKEN